MSIRSSDHQLHLLTLDQQISFLRRLAKCADPGDEIVLVCKRHRNCLTSFVSNEPSIKSLGMEIIQVPLKRPDTSETGLKPISQLTSLWGVPAITRTKQSTQR